MQELHSTSRHSKFRFLVIGAEGDGGKLGGGEDECEEEKGDVSEGVLEPFGRELLRGPQPFVLVTPYHS